MANVYIFEEDNNYEKAYSYYLKTISYFSAKLKKQELRDSLINAPTELDAFNLLLHS